MQKSKRVEMMDDLSDDDDNGDGGQNSLEDDTSFISGSHLVRFDSPVSHVCDCVYNVTVPIPPSLANEQRSTYTTPNSPDKLSQQQEQQQRRYPTPLSPRNESSVLNNSELNHLKTRTKPVNCLAIAGRDGFIRIFESQAPFSLLFAFPIRYERVLSLDFIPKTSSFVTVEHTTDGSGNHVVVYEDWQKFPNLLKNVQIVEKQEHLIFKFVSRKGLPLNGYIAITAPGNMRLQQLQVEGINGNTQLTFDVRIRNVTVTPDGQLIKETKSHPIEIRQVANTNIADRNRSGLMGNVSSNDYFSHNTSNNTNTNASGQSNAKNSDNSSQISDPSKVSSDSKSSQSGHGGTGKLTSPVVSNSPFGGLASRFGGIWGSSASSSNNNSVTNQNNNANSNIANSSNNNNSNNRNRNDRSSQNRRDRNQNSSIDFTKLIIFELRACGNVQLGPGAYRISMPVTWKNRPRQRRFRREIFGIEFCHGNGNVIEAAQQLWMIDFETAAAAAQGYKQHPIHGGKINLCVENIRTLRKLHYIKQMQIFELGTHTSDGNTSADTMHTLEIKNLGMQPPPSSSKSENLRKRNEIREIVSSVYDGINEDDPYKTQQSWFPSDFKGSGNSIASNAENVTCISVCRESGRLVTGYKSIINVWDCDLMLRTYNVQATTGNNNRGGGNTVERGNISDIRTKTNVMKDKRHSYRLGATSSKKMNQKIDSNINSNSNKLKLGKKRGKKEIAIVTLRTAPIKILQLHSSFIVRILHLKNNYLAFASDHETRLVYLDIISHSEIMANNSKSARMRQRQRLIESVENNDFNESSSDDNDDFDDIIDVYERKKQKKLRRKRLKKQQEQMGHHKHDTESDDSDSVSSSDDSGADNDNNNNKKASSKNENDLNMKGIDNVSIVFNDGGCPSIKHHAANFMLIPSIYEYNRFQPNRDTSPAAMSRQQQQQQQQQSSLEGTSLLAQQYPFEMITQFADHAHRIDLSMSLMDDQLVTSIDSGVQTTGENLAGNIVILSAVKKKSKKSWDKEQPLILGSGNGNPQISLAQVEKDMLERSQAMFDIKQMILLVHRRFAPNDMIRTLQVIEDQRLKFGSRQHIAATIGSNRNHNKKQMFGGNKIMKKRKSHRLFVRESYHPSKFLIATDDEVHVYNLKKERLDYSLHFASGVVETYIDDLFLFVLTEKEIAVYCCEASDNGDLLLLWKHPLLRMCGMRILHNNTFCLEFGSQTVNDRFSMNADGRRLRLHQFDLRLRVQMPNDPNKRPLTIFEQNSPKNVLMFEWSPISEMVLSLIAKSHDCMISQWLSRARHLLIIALKMINVRNNELYPSIQLLKEKAALKEIEKQKLKGQENEKENESDIATTNVSKPMMATTTTTTAATPSPIPATTTVNTLASSKGKQGSSKWSSWISNTLQKAVQSAQSSSIGQAAMNAAQNASNAITSVVGNPSVPNPIEAIPKKSIIQSEWAILKQLKKECHGLIADVYLMEGKYEVASQHYIRSNRKFYAIRDIFAEHIKNSKNQNEQDNTNKHLNVKNVNNGKNNGAIDGLTLFYRLFLENEERCRSELNNQVWYLMMQHFVSYNKNAFSTILLHPYMLAKLCEKNLIEQSLKWIDQCIFEIENKNTKNEQSLQGGIVINLSPMSLLNSSNNVDYYANICPSTVSPTALPLVKATHYLARVIISCLYEMEGEAEATFKRIETKQLKSLLERHKRLWIGNDWSYCQILRRLCSTVCPWIFAKVVLNYCTYCYKKEKWKEAIELQRSGKWVHYNRGGTHQKNANIGIGDIDANLMNANIGTNSNNVENSTIDGVNMGNIDNELFPLPSLTFEESMDYFKHSNAGPSLTQCYLEGCIRYLLDEINYFERLQKDTNRSLISEHQIRYARYLAELEQIGFALIESYVQYLQDLCFQDTERALLFDDDNNNTILSSSMHNNNNNSKNEDKEAIEKAEQMNKRQRHIWKSKYPFATQALPTWLTMLLESVQEEFLKKFNIEQEQQEEYLIQQARKQRLAKKQNEIETQKQRKTDIDPLRADDVQRIDDLENDLDEEEERQIQELQNEQMFIMARLCTILTCIDFGKSDRSETSETTSMRWKRRLDLLLASCPDIPSKYVDSLLIVGYVSCNCISHAIELVLKKEQSIIVDFALSYCQSFKDWKVLLNQILQSTRDLLAKKKETNERMVQLRYEIRKEKLVKERKIETNEESENKDENKDENKNENKNGNKSKDRISNAEHDASLGGLEALGTIVSFEKVDQENTLYEKEKEKEKEKEMENGESENEDEHDCKESYKLTKMRLRETEIEIAFLQSAYQQIWYHLGRLSSVSTQKSSWLSVKDLISLVPNDGNLEFFAPIFCDLLRNQAGDALNMELFDKIIQFERDKDYGFSYQMHEVLHLGPV